MKCLYTVSLAMVFLLTAAPVSADDRTAPAPSFLGKLFGKQEDFTDLKRQRRQLSNEISRLERESRVLDSQSEQLTRQLEDAPSEIYRIDDQLKLLETVIGRKSEAITKSSPSTKPLVKSERFDSEFDFLLSKSIEDLKSRKSSAEQRRKEILERQQRLAQVKEETKKKRDEIDAKQASLFDIEERISQALNVGTNQYLYRTAVSLIFAAIVFFLVLQFFRVVQDNEEVKKSIFSGDTGIQFITLFSIVIAVILFGILEILGANELSALLGGLSGYILGKSSPKRETAG